MTREMVDVVGLSSEISQTLLAPELLGVSFVTIGRVLLQTTVGFKGFVAMLAIVVVGNYSNMNYFLMAL